MEIHITVDGYGIDHIGRHSMSESCDLNMVDEHLEARSLMPNNQNEGSIRAKRIASTGNLLFYAPATEPGIQDDLVTVTKETRIDVKSN
jgi:hypothetical protein